MRSEPEVHAAMSHFHHEPRWIRGRRRHRGAALVVGLVLLAVITLLAVAQINSASLELKMAGNLQYQERAFQAAETGIEQTLAIGQFAVPQRSAEIHDNVPISASEKFSTVLTADLDGLAQPPTWGNSWNSFSSYHFAIRSTGMSSRGAQAIHNQGAAKLSPSAATITGRGALD
jgi:Tfp pilus assembly protein PilX